MVGRYSRFDDKNVKKKKNICINDEEIRIMKVYGNILCKWRGIFGVTKIKLEHIPSNSFMHLVPF